MKAVLKSESPASCELIVNGKKTILLSKTKPKLEPPFKCYIYCTKGMELWGDGSGMTWRGIDPDEDMEQVYNLNPTLSKLNGKVIGEFVCDEIEDLYYGCGQIEGSGISDYKGLKTEDTCLTHQELLQYGKGNLLSGWDISELKIYDEPKELGEFSYPECKDAKHCDNCPSYENLGYPYDDRCLTNRFKRVTRPPQLWCYVEEL